VRRAPFSYRNCVVAEHEGKLIGLLHSFLIEAEQGASSDGPPDPVLEPCSMEVPGSFYICSLTVLPEFRGLGLGTKMLDIAREQARERGLDTLSLLVFEQNHGASRLYEREGFEVVNRTRVVPHELIHHTGDVLLMVAEV
jgi:ribosomal protein S18 acetylase RimI-like enzyme